MMRSPYLTAYYEHLKAKREDMPSPKQPDKPVRARTFRKKARNTELPGLFSFSPLCLEEECSFEPEEAPFSCEVLMDIFQSKLTFLEKMQQNIEDLDDKTLLFQYISDVEGPFSHIISNPQQEIREPVSSFKPKILARIDSERQKMQDLLHEQQLSEYLASKNAQLIEQPEERQLVIDELYIFLQDALVYGQVSIEFNKHYNQKNQARGIGHSKRNKHKLHQESFVVLDESKETFTYVALLEESLAYIHPWTSIALKDAFLSTVCKIKRGRAETALDKNKAKIQMFIKKGLSLVKNVESTLLAYETLLQSIPKEVEPSKRSDIEKIAEECSSLKKNLVKAMKVNSSDDSIRNTRDLNVAVQLLNAINMAMQTLENEQQMLMDGIEILKSEIPPEALKKTRSDETEGSGILPADTHKESVKEEKTEVQAASALQIDTYDLSPKQPDTLDKGIPATIPLERKKAPQLSESASQDTSFLRMPKKYLTTLTDIVTNQSYKLHNQHTAKELFTLIKYLGGSLKNIRGSHYTFKLNQHSFVLVDHPKRGMKKLSGTYIKDFKYHLDMAGIQLKSLYTSARAQCI